MLRRFWLFFAQTVTVVLVVWFVIAMLKPDWLQHGRIAAQPGSPIVVLEGVAPIGHDDTSSNFYTGTTKAAIPAVVNTFNNKNAPKRGTNPQASADPWFRLFFGNRVPEQRQKPTTNLGPGVIVSSEGYILTDHHVVDGTDEIEVALTDSRRASAKTVDSNSETDPAVLKINPPNPPAITLGRLENMYAGNMVLAIGNSLGVGQMVTVDAISALGHSHLGISASGGFIQTDATINLGSSGGALVDANDNLLGINTTIYSCSGGPLGIGFAIPVSLAGQVMESITSIGSMVRSWIGVESQDVTPEIVESFGLSCRDGALIVTAVRGGPADRMGLRLGDILTSMNGQPILDTMALLNSITQLELDAGIKMTVSRKSRAVELTIVVGKRSPPVYRSVPMPSQDDGEQQ